MVITWSHSQTETNPCQHKHILTLPLPNRTCFAPDGKWQREVGSLRAQKAGKIMVTRNNKTAAKSCFARMESFVMHMVRLPWRNPFQAASTQHDNYSNYLLSAVKETRWNLENLHVQIIMVFSFNKTMYVFILPESLLWNWCTKLEKASPHCTFPGYYAIRLSFVSQSAIISMSIAEFFSLQEQEVLCKGINNCVNDGKLLHAEMKTTVPIKGWFHFIVQYCSLACKNNTRTYVMTWYAQSNN